MHAVGRALEQTKTALQKNSYRYYTSPVDSTDPMPASTGGERGGVEWEGRGMGCRVGGERMGWRVGGNHTLAFKVCH